MSVRCLYRGDRVGILVNERTPEDRSSQTIEKYVQRKESIVIEVIRLASRGIRILSRSILMDAVAKSGGIVELLVLGILEA